MSLSGACRSVLAKSSAARFGAGRGLQQGLPLKPRAFLNLLAHPTATVVWQYGPWLRDGWRLGGVVVAGGADRHWGQR